MSIKATGLREDYRRSFEEQNIPITKCRERLHAARLALISTATSIAGFAATFICAMIYAFSCGKLGKEDLRELYQSSRNSMSIAKHSFCAIFSFNKEMEQDRYAQVFFETYGQKKIFFTTLFTCLVSKWNRG